MTAREALGIACAGTLGLLAILTTEFAVTAFLFLSLGPGGFVVGVALITASVHLAGRHALRGLRAS